MHRNSLTCTFGCFTRTDSIFQDRFKSLEACRNPSQPLQQRHNQGQVQSGHGDLAAFSLQLDSFPYLIMEYPNHETEPSPGWSTYTRHVRWIEWIRLRNLCVSGFSLVLAHLIPAVGRSSRYDRQCRAQKDRVELQALARRTKYKAIRLE